MRKQIENGRGAEEQEGKKKERKKPLYSRKLHIRVRRERTSCVTSFVTLVLSFGDNVVNHFASRFVSTVRRAYLLHNGIMGGEEGR